ncbi:MAG: hypothetical protein U0175_18055 [Caldilineaceae bacterium]
MKAKFVLRKRALIVLLILILGSVSVSMAAPSFDNSLSPGVGYDPLNAAEQQRALNMALGNAGGVSGGINGSGVRSEILLVERHQESKDIYRQGVWPRRADVYVYNYDANTLEHRVVNLASNTIDVTEVFSGVQLPPTANEIQTSIDLAFNAPQFHSDLAAWYKKLKGEELVSFDQLASKAFIFHASAMGTANVGNAKVCGIERCVQLMVYTKDMIAFEQSPIVNLSSQQLATVLQPGQ